MTKYDMTRTIASHLQKPIDHVIPDTEKPVVKPGTTERPENTQLSVTVLKELGIDTGEGKTFDAWWGGYLKEKPKGH